MFKNIENYIFDKLYNELWHNFCNSDYNQMLLDDTEILDTILSRANKIKQGVAIELNTNIIYEKLSDEEISQLKLIMKRNQSRFGSRVRSARANSGVRLSAATSGAISARPSRASVNSLGPISPITSPIHANNNQNESKFNETNTISK